MENQIKDNLTTLWSRICKIVDIKYRPNPQEEKLEAIINHMLEMDSTLKIVSADKTYYLINDTYHYYIKVCGETVIITNTVDSVTRFCSMEFVVRIRKLIDAKIEKDIQALEQKIFDGEMHILKNLGEKL